MNQSTVLIVADNFAGPTRPHVKMMRYLHHHEARIHHATETKAMRALARLAWGDKADVVRIASGHYEAVWCGYPTEPFPELEAGYRRIHEEWKLNGDRWESQQAPVR